MCCCGSFPRMKLRSWRVFSLGCWFLKEHESHELWISYISNSKYTVHIIYTLQKKTNLEIQQPSMAMKPLYTSYIVSQLHTVDGRNPANQLRLVVYPIIYRVLYIPGGCLGFLPSTVVPVNMECFHDFPAHDVPSSSVIHSNCQPWRAQSALEPSEGVRC